MFNTDEYYGSKVDCYFVPREGGYHFYPSRWSKGYPVSAEEYETYKQQIVDRAQGALFYVMLIFLSILALSVSVAFIATGQVWILIVALAILCSAIWHYLRPGRLLARIARARGSSAPKRSKREWDEIIASHSSWFTLLWPGGYLISMVLLYAHRWPEVLNEDPYLLAVWGLLLVIFIYFLPGLIMAKLRQRRSQSDAT